MAIKKVVGKVVALTNKEKMVAFAAAQAAYENKHSGGGGESISLRGGIMTYGGGAVPGNALQCVVIAALAESVYYPDKYDPDNVQPPVCYAFGTGDEMVPHPEATQPQHETCEGCPQNEWGSAETGRGKACKQVRKLALITADALEDVNTATVAFVRIPVTSVRSWSGYVDQLERTLHLPPMGVVTEMSVKPDAKTQFSVGFKFVEEINDEEALEALMERHGPLIEQMSKPYAAPEEPPVKPARKVVQNVAVTGRKSQRVNV